MRGAPNWQGTGPENRRAEMPLWVRVPPPPFSVAEATFGGHSPLNRSFTKEIKMPQDAEKTTAYSSSEPYERVSVSFRANAIYPSRDSETCHFEATFRKPRNLQELRDAIVHFDEAAVLFRSTCERQAMDLLRQAARSR